MKENKVFRWVLISTMLLMLVFTFGCPKLPPPDPMNPIATVAVLPVQNMTNDMDAPNWIRVAFANIMPSRYYQLVPSDQVDVELREKMNITLAGQLDYTNPGIGAPTPEEVGKLLGVDGLFYCNLIDFQNLITGLYNRRKVKASCKLVNTKTAAIAWEKEAEQSTHELNITPQAMLQSAIGKVVESALTKAFRANPLQQETNSVMHQMQWSIPSGPVAPPQEK